MPDTPLSDLQQFILAMAIFHRKHWFRDEDTQADVYSYEVIGARWGFRTADGRPLHAWAKRTDSWPHFPTTTLGPPYQVARVSVSKALRRLEQRGLGRRGWYTDGAGQVHLGFTLTAVGLPVATQAYQHVGGDWEDTFWAGR